MRSCCRLYLSGLVQGVNLRWRVREYSNKKNLVGWIINLADGSVEMEWEGEKDKVEEAVNWILSTGAGVAKIENYKIEISPVKNQKGFYILS